MEEKEDNDTAHSFPKPKTKRKYGHRLGEDTKEAFLKLFRDTGFVYQTSKQLGIDPLTVHNWINKDPVFASKMQQANEEITEKCETAALLRAVNGILQPVFQGGKKVGEIRVYSDRLLELILKARNRRKYSDRPENEFDERIGDRLIAMMSNHFVNVVRRIAPDICPHCKTKLAISTKISEEMMALSGKMRP